MAREAGRGELGQLISPVGQIDSPPEELSYVFVYYISFVINMGLKPSEQKSHFKNLTSSHDQFAAECGYISLLVEISGTGLLL